MIDELVIFSEYDPELRDGLQWLDKEAFKRGITSYQMIHAVLAKFDVEEKAMHWYAKRHPIG